MGEVINRRNHDDRSLRSVVADRGNSNPAANYGPSTTLLRIMDSKEFFYHHVQQTDKMLDDSRRRSRLSRELQRRSEMERLRRKGVSLDHIVPTPVPVDQFLVTLTLHVNQTEQEELTNCMGSNLDGVAKISVETNTIIRIPDRDEVDPYLKSQVTVTGKLANVEQARLRIRECGLIDVMFPLINVRPEVPLGSREKIVHYLLDKEFSRFIPAHLRVIIMDRNCLFKQSFIVKIVGRTTDEKIINETILRLLDLFYTPEMAAQVPLATQVDMPSCHRFIVVGHGEAINNNLLAIAKITNTSILFPAPSIGDSPVFSCFILGNLDVLQKTRMYLQGLLPAQLSFTIYDSDLSYERETDSTYKHFDRNSQVFLRVQPSELQPLVRLPNDPLIHYFCLSTREYNVNRMYSVVDLTVRGSDSSKIPVPPTNSMFHQLIPLLSDPSHFLNFKSRADPKNFHIPPTRREMLATDNHLRNETPIPVDPSSRMHAVAESADSCCLSQTSYDGCSGRPRSSVQKLDENMYPVYPHRTRVQNNDLRFNNTPFYGNKSFRPYNNARLRTNDKRPPYGITKANLRYSPFTPNKSELPLKPKIKEDNEVYYALNDSEISGMNQSIDVDRSKRSRPITEENGYRYASQPSRLQPRREHHYEEKVQLRYRAAAVAAAPCEDENIPKKSTTESSVQYTEPPMSPSGDTSRRMNVMELIMKAAEEPQSAARNREMKESNDDDLEEKQHRTYAEILEGKTNMDRTFLNDQIYSREPYEQWDYV